MKPIVHRFSIREPEQARAHGLRAGPFTVALLFWAGVLTVALLFCADAAAPEIDLHGTVVKRTLYRVPIVVEDFAIEASPGERNDPLFFSGGERPEDLLVQDLRFSDAFQVVRRRQGSFDPAGEPPRDIDGALVEQPIQARVVGRMEWDDERLRLKAELIDQGTGNRILDREVAINREGELARPDRWAIHRLSDEITRYLTGTPGCAATRIAFLRESRSGKELFLVDWDGYEEQAVTGLGTILVSPAWHPSGERIAFTSYHRGAPVLVALDLESRRLATLSTAPTPAAAVYSPNGKRVAFSTTAEGDAELYVARADGSHARRLTFHPDIDTAPCWSPSGERLVFTSDRCGRPQLFLIDADGSNLQQLTFSGEWNDSPDWSPAGSRIVHVCQIGGRFELALIDVQGFGWRRLTVGGGCENPRWAPDGRHVVFALTQAGVRNLWILDADSGNLRQLTASPDHSYNPGWSRPARERIRASG
ncbi:MAG: PD40 domain-containing protein [Candidatus Eisenbacteria sp.]|nr:PD40 domain-containing protein [Candidatus Eisenbacteria bacterium]